MLIWVSHWETATPSYRLPTSYGMILYPGFQALDVFGPLDALNILSSSRPMNLSLIAATMDPVSTKPPPGLRPNISNFAESVVPTHTFDNAPPLDVLFVPGGLGSLLELNSTKAFIKATYPTLQYLITVCTGSALVAETGILDGRKATTNKADWARQIAKGPRVNWVPRARWVVDGNIWTSSGVSAGIDVTLAFVEHVYGRQNATRVANLMEYDRNTDSSWDPFATVFNVPGA